MSDETINCRTILRHGDFIMRNHRVHGVSIMPGVTFLDLTYRVLAARGVPAAGLALREVVFAEAVATSETVDREIRLRVGAERAGIRPVLGESRALRDGVAASEWRENFRAELVQDHTPTPPALDPSGLVAAAIRRREMTEMYAHTRSRDIQHGTAMQCRGTLHVGPDYLLADLEQVMPDAGSEDRFYLHPAKLDAGTIAAYGQSSNSVAEPFIPMFIERFRAPRPLRGRFWLHVPRPEELTRSGELFHSDFLLYDAGGEFVAECTRLACKRIRRPELIERLVVSTPAEPGTAEPVTAYSRWLRDRIAGLLSRSAAEIDSGAGFYDLGLDSVAMLSISEDLQRLTGARLYPTLLFEHTDIDALARYLAGAYGQPKISDEPPERATVEGTAGDQSDPERMPEPHARTLAFRPVWSRAEPTGDPARLDVVLVDAPASLAESLRSRVEAAGGHLEVVSSRNGDLDTRDRHQLAATLTARRPARGGRAVVLAGALSRVSLVPAPPELPVSTAISVWGVATALVDLADGGSWSLLYLYEGSGHDVEPGDAAVAALAATISAESRLRCGAVEVERRAPADTVATAVLAELSDPAGHAHVRYRSGVRQVRRHVPASLGAVEGLAPLRPGGVYVVAGGSGGLGLLLAQHLLTVISARVVLSGRRPASPEVERRLSEWATEGLRARYVPADVTRASDVVALMRDARTNLGPINGVFHCAGVVHDGLFPGKRAEEIEAVLLPKVAGITHLDAATADDDLDIFVAFSSLAAVAPNPGQCDYAYANAYLDAYIENRSARADRPGRSLSIGWPLWAEGGMRMSPDSLARARQQLGTKPMPTAAGLEVLRQALAGSAPQITVVHGDPRRVGDVLPVGEPVTEPLAEPTGATADPARRVAVIGLSGQYPQSPDLTAFWRNLVHGRDCITEVPADRWDPEVRYHPRKGRVGTTYSRWGGFLSGADLFDPGFFGISRREAEWMDPQERLFLMTCWHALEDAGYPPQQLTGQSVGVFVGVMWNHYQLASGGEGDVRPTAMHAAIANRVSYALDLHGPSMAIDTACSASLTTVHLAVQSITCGESDLALAGGVNVSAHEQKYLQLARGQFLATDGRCRSFGAGGSGYVPGEGVGAIVLKPLDRALADGDHVYGVITATAVNHTGRSSGFTVPNAASQTAVIRSALTRAGLGTPTLDYVEAHGTGTSLGDPIEIEGLRKALDPDGDLPVGSVPIGSVKSNIGHLESAAGIAGITKVLLQFQHRQLVPSLHADEVNPHIDFTRTPFAVQRVSAPWRPRREGDPLRAGVSAFGAGGANAHLILESYQNGEPAPAAAGLELFLLSARDDDGLRAYAESWLGFLAETGGRAAADRPGGADLRVVVSAAADLLGVPATALDPGAPLADLGMDATSLALLRSRLGDHRPETAVPETGESHLDDTLADLAGAPAVPDSDGPAPALADLAYTLQVGRTPMERRLALVVRSREEINAGLTAFLAGEPPTAGQAWSGAPRPPQEDWAEELLRAFRNGNLDQVAAAWVAGADIPWSIWRSPAERRRRVRLPGYPFRLERCWLGGWQSARTSATGTFATQPGSAPAPELPQPTADAGSRLDQGAGVELRMLDHGIALVRMRDATGTNMFSDELMHGLRAAFAEIDRDSDVRAVVLTGTDTVFSMGATPEALERLARHDARFTDSPFIYEGLLRCDRPVVSAIAGHACGGGLAFGLYADIVVLSRTGLYSANFLQHGFTPGMGATYILEQRLGRSLAAEMLFTGRRYSGADLERRGANITVQPAADVLPTAIDFARSLAEKPAAAVAALKAELASRILDQLPAVIDREVSMHTRVLGEESAERVSAYFRKVRAASEQVPPVPAETAAQPPPTQLDGAEVEAELTASLQAILYAERHELNRTVSFHELGVDSIGAVEIVSALNRRFGLDLDSIAVYDHPTIPALVDHVQQSRALKTSLHQAALYQAAGPSPVLADSTPRGQASSPPERAPDAVTLKPLDRPAADPVKRPARAGVTSASAAGSGRSTADPGPRRRDGDIAIIGASGRFPGAANLESFWANLINGRHSIDEVPTRRWGPPERYFDADRSAPNRAYSRWAALLPEIDTFDAKLFNLSPMEAELMDPQQRLFLEESWAALEDAGYAAAGERRRYGVYVGCSAGDYSSVLRAAGQGDAGQTFLGTNLAILAARIGYLLNFSGPTMAVDTACSSSLVAVHLASEAIRNEECEIALAGGIALMVTSQMQVWTSRVGMLSPSGRCAPFDASADGIVLGEGVGVVVLKSLERALRDGDRIHAVIKGSGVNSDGRTNGITAPSAVSQRELLESVQSRAGIRPANIGFIEAHGTGTPLGDPIELKAVNQVFASVRGACGIGSVKANIGHTMTAAGIAGLLKVVLALRHRQLPPQPNFRSVNPKIDMSGPLFVVTQITPWEPGPGGERIGSVSSFGFSGTNAHVVLAEAPVQDARDRTTSTSARPPHVVPVSARTEAALTTVAGRLAGALDRDGTRPALADVAYTLGAGRAHLPVRAALVVNDLTQLHRGLLELASDPARRAAPLGHGEPGEHATAIAEEYLRGGEIDWKALYRGARRVGLPTYPFARTRHWADATEPDDRVATASLVAGDPADPAERELTPADPIVADHRMGGTPVLPGMATVALALAAARGSLPATFAVRAVRWERPLKITGPTRVRWVVETGGDRRAGRLVADDPAGSSSSSGMDQALTFARTSLETPGKNGSDAPSTGSGPQPPRDVDLATVAARCPEELLGAECYAAFERAGLRYGPIYRRLRRVAFGRDEAVAELIEPVGATPGDDPFEIDTAILDAAVQAVLPLSAPSPTAGEPPTASTAGRPLLPFSAERIVIHRPLLEVVFSHAVRGPRGTYTIHLLDRAGQLCAAVTDLVLRPLPAQGPPGNAVPPVAAETSVYVPVWRKARDAGHHDPSLGRVGGSSDARSHPTVGVWHPSVARDLAEALIARCLPDTAHEAGGSHRVSAVAIRYQDEACDLGTLTEPPDVVYFLTDPDPVGAPEHDPSTTAFFNLVRALIAAGGHRREITVKAVVAGIVPARDGDRLRPHAAGVAGLCASLAAELPHWRVTCIDVGGDGAGPEDLARCIHEEPGGHRLVALRQGQRLVRAFVPAPSNPTWGANPAGSGPWRRGGSYLILGGAGGIGLVLARHLARTASARLTLIGRRPQDERINAALADIRSLGGEGIYLRADAADAEALTAAVHEAQRHFGPVHGAVHAAMVLRDQTLASADVETLREVLAPKITGSTALLEALRGTAPDLLIFFSSVAAFIDSPGQGNYAAASTFVDSYGRFLDQRLPYPVVVVNWGYWGSVGAVADPVRRRRLAELGVGSIEPEDGIAALERILRVGAPQALVIKADPTRWTGLDLPSPHPVATPEPPDLERARAAFADLDQVARGLLRQHLAAGDWIPSREVPVSLEEIALRLEVAPTQHRLLLSVLGALERAGVVRLGHGEVTWRTDSDDGDTLTAGTLLARYPEMRPHVELLKACIPAVPEVLAGRVSGTAVLFPGGSTRLVEPVYTGHPGTDYYHQLLVGSVTEAAQRIAPGLGRPLELLEVGAGTGASTSQIVAALEASHLEVRYHYTDISPALVNHGREAFADRYGFMCFGSLDIERDPTEQGYPAGSVDIVIATNVLHATTNIGATLGWVRALLQPGGLLQLNEVTRSSDFLALTFGLTTGWWRFDDEAHRLPGAPLLNPEQWQAALIDAGLRPVSTRGFPRTPLAQLEQCVIVAERTGITEPPGSVTGPALAAAREYLRTVFAEVLKCPTEDLDDNSTFENFGVDSLVGQHIVYRLERDLGELPATLLFEHLTITDLASHLVEAYPRPLARHLSPAASAPEDAPVGSARAAEPEPAPVPVPTVVPEPGGHGEDIAVVGVVGRYPQAGDLRSFWDLLASGRDAVTTVPPQRWNWRTHFDPRRGRRGSSYSRWGAFLDGIDQFDPAFFGILPRDAADIDPQERLFLETCWNLLDGAGYLDDRWHERDTGVFVGLMYGSYGRMAAAGWPSGQFTGAHSAYWSVSNRVSYVFDFQGPSFAIDSACSSSLTAVHLACESLRRGECRMAIAGGVNLVLHPSHHIALSGLTMLSADGACKTFDEQADGFVPGEGVGAVLLKPLTCAVDDGDDIWAVIKGSHVNAGGKTGGYTVPNPAAQSRLIVEAIRRSGVDPATLGHVEVHGTGTKLGDPIEMASLTIAFRTLGTTPTSCAVSSVKANIGHLEGAAGIAGLTKALLQLRHGQLVPCTNLGTLNPKIDFGSCYPPRELLDWPRPLNAADPRAVLPRRAGVSSFGAGGANAHVVLEEYLPAQAPPPVAADDREPRLFLLSARTPDQLTTYASRVANALADPDGPAASIQELAYSSQVGRRALTERLAVLARNTDELIKRLRAFSTGQAHPDVIAGAGTSRDGEDEPVTSTLVDVRQLEALGRAWAAGANVDWNAFWPAPRPRRAALPAYPFSRERYWLANPLPPAERPGDDGTTETVALTGLRAACLRDHLVGGRRWLPGVLALDIVHAVAVRHGAASHTASDVVELRDVRWPTPLVMTGEPQVTVVLRPSEAGLAFQVAASDDPAARVAATGTWVTTATRPAPRMELAAVESRCPRVADVPDFYARLREAGLHHGPVLRVVRQLRTGEGEAFAVLEAESGTSGTDTSDDGGDRGRRLHPAIMDGALQVVASLDGATTAEVPVSAARVTSHAPVPDRCRAHVREITDAAATAGSLSGRRRFDVQIVDETGQVVLSIEGLQTSPVAIEGGTLRYLRAAWVPEALPVPSRPPRIAVVFTPESWLAEPVTRRLADRGIQAVRVLPGAAFTRTGADGFTVRPGEPEDHKRLVAELAASGPAPDAVVHLVGPASGTPSSTDLDEELNRGMYPFLWLTTSLLAGAATTPLRAVFGHAPATDPGAPEGIRRAPHHAAVAAVMRTLALEHSGFAGTCVNLEPAGGPEAWAECLAAELLAVAENAAEVGYHAGSRRRRELVPGKLDPAGDAAGLPLRPEGSYLVTGASGVLARYVVPYLAEGGRPLNLVLTGRRAPDAELSAWLGTLSGDGVQVQWIEAELADRRDVWRLVSAARARFGDLHGVLHLAGTTRDGRAVSKRRDDITAVLGAKVAAAINLDEALAAEPLDFFVLFSSLAGETGNVGQVDYAFANAFLNEFAREREIRRAAGACAGRTVSIGWPLWEGGGMRVSDGVRRTFARRYNMIPLNIESGLEVLGQALTSPEPAFSVVRGTEPPAVPDDGDPPASGPAGLVAEIENELRAIAATFLLVQPQDVDLDADLMETGFDSVSLTELVNAVNDRYGLDLLPTVLFECSHLAAFGHYLLDRLGDRLSSPPAPGPSVPATVESAPAEPRPAEPAPTQRTTPDYGPMPIAIIGMAAIMPGAGDIETFWQHLLAGNQLVGPIPEDREDLRADPATRDLRGGFVSGIADFDETMFGIAPTEAALLDPQQRLFLETAWRAVENAGYPASELAGSRTGLFVGVSTSDYDDLLRTHGIEVQAHTATGLAHSILANRVSRMLDLRGPSEAVDTACSSALVALHRAIRAIGDGDCDTAIAGGVNAILSPGLFVAFTKSGMLSPEGRCKTFDAAADGYVRGEGAGVVLLKRLDRAESDGDHIYGIIRAIAVNHGGRSSSLTAPNLQAQAEVILDAHRRGGVDPVTVSYVEAHGTGTRLGDPVEVEGLKQAFARLYTDWGRPAPQRPHIGVGSVKTNIGHLEAAAGIAGVVKVLLSMRHGAIPATLNVTKLNPLLRLAGTPFYIHDRLRPWTGVRSAEGETVRRAGVSSFGFGGSNAHVVIEDYRPPQTADEPRRSQPEGGYLAVLSAPNEPALNEYAATLAATLKNVPAIDLARVIYTLQVGRENHSERLAVLAENREQLVELLTAAAGGAPQSTDLWRGGVAAGGSAVPDPGGHDLASLGRAWVAGANVVWRRLWPDPPRRLPLPGFPFTKTRHWLTPRIEPSPQTRSAARVSGASVSGPSTRPRIRLAPTPPGLPSHVHTEGSPAAAPPRLAPAVVAPPAAAPDPDGTERGAAEIIREALVEILGLPRESLTDDVSFTGLGLDSIFRMELTRRINGRYGLDLKAGELYQHDTISQFATVVAGAVARPGPSEGTQAELECQLTDLIARTTGHQLGPQSFADSGMTSFDMLRTISVLERNLGALRKTLLFDHSTIAELAAHLLRTYGDGVAALLGDTAAGSDPAPAAAESPRSAPPTAAHPEAPVVVSKRRLPVFPGLAQTVAALDERFGKEGGLAGRDIAPLIFLSAGREGYFNFSRRDDVLFAWSYVGPADHLPTLATQYVDYASRYGLKPNFLSVVRVEQVAGRPFTATPFGAVQRLENLPEFTLHGQRMHRLRNLIRRFTSAGDCGTHEYTVGSEPEVDRQIADLMDRWAETKQMVNPYLTTVRQEIRRGHLDARHRTFLTRVDGHTTSAVIVTKIPSEPGYLLDLEFYPKDAPRGGLEYAIVSIIETLRAEGVQIFSFGASFGVKLGESPNTSPEVEAGMAELRSVGIFGVGNFQFKNKFRPTNQPIYLCQPAGEGRTSVSDVILMIANPDLAATSPEELADGQTLPATVPGHGELAGRAELLERYGYSPLALPTELVELDLATDSWAELTGPVIAERMRQLSGRANGIHLAGAELPAADWLPFELVVPTSSGRAAEALLCRCWPAPPQIVLHNGVFPTWHLSLAESGFRQLALGPPRRTGPEGIFADVDLDDLDRAVAAHAGRVSFVCLELANNSLGGYPVTPANLEEVRRRLAAHGVPLVLDCARAVDAAVLIVANDPEQRGREVWQVLRELLQCADAVTMSLTKDYGVDAGGLVATSEPVLAARLREQIAARGHQVNLSTRRLIAAALADHTGVVEQVELRMAAVRTLWQCLSESGWPVLDPAGAHCVVVDVARIEAFADLPEAVASYLVWVYRHTGVRGAPHLETDPERHSLVRFAVPVGTTVSQARLIGDRLVGLARSAPPPPDLVSTGSNGGTRTFLPTTVEVPEDIRAASRHGARAGNDNLGILRDYGAPVEHHLLELPDGTVEAVTAGAGPTLLLLHPFNIGAGFFVHQFLGLGDRCRVVVIHAPGVGATSGISDLSLTGLAAMHRAALDRLGVAAPFHLAGASFGGLTAQAFALDHPREVASLTLMCSSYRSANRAGEVNRLEVVMAEDFDRLAEVGKPLEPSERARLERILLRSESMDPQTGLRYLDVFATEPTLRERLRDITTPTLLVQGLHDCVIPRETTRLLHQEIPGCRLIELDDSGHFPTLTQPEDLNRVLASFLAEHDSGPDRGGDR